MRDKVGPLVRRLLWSLRALPLGRWRMDGDKGAPLGASCLMVGIEGYSGFCWHLYSPGEHAFTFIFGCDLFMVLRGFQTYPEHVKCEGK